MAEAEFYKVAPTPSMEDAKTLHEALKKADADQPLRLDASEVEAMTTPFVLTVLSAMEARAALTPPVVVKGASDEFVAAFTDLGLFQEMMKMEFAT